MLTLVYQRVYNVGPPVMLVGLYKPHEYYNYLRTINHSYWGYFHQLSYPGGTTLQEIYIYIYIYIYSLLGQP